MACIRDISDSTTPIEPVVALSSPVTIDTKNESAELYIIVISILMIDGIARDTTSFLTGSLVIFSCLVIVVII